MIVHILLLTQIYPYGYNIIIRHTPMGIKTIKMVNRTIHKNVYLTVPIYMDACIETIVNVYISLYISFHRR